MTAEPDLLPSSIAAFTEALHGDRGSLDAWLEANDEHEVAAHVEAYARANVEHAVAPLQAEVEALRAEVDRLNAELVRLEKIAGYGGLASDAPERMILASDVYDGMQSCDKWCEVRRVIDDGQPMPESATPYVRADRAERLAEALRELRNHAPVNSDQIALIDAALERENDDA